MNPKLKKQIKTYAGVAAAIFAGEKAKGQVVYVDVNPDTLIEIIPCDTLSQSYFLDVDNDNVNDFHFLVDVICNSTNWNSFFDRRFIQVTPLNSNKIGCYYDYAYPYPFANGGFYLVPKKLSAGDTINNGGIWNASPDFLWTHFSHYDSVSCCPGGYLGAWRPPNFGEGCLPFMLNKNSNTYFGWMHIKVITHSSFILKDYAYQLQPNAPMLACDTTNLATGFSEHNQQQFNFSQQNNSIHISSFQKLNHANISIYDLLGKEISQQSFEGKETTIKIDKKGIYFAEVNSDKGVFRKKIFIY